MVRDKANIFKLEKKSFKNYLEDPFFDCIPGAKEYAECMKSSIITKETPYVLMLDEKFGMGKTYFTTRFTQYLRNNNINTIYFSAWENDYFEYPFEAFSKEILLYINNLTLGAKLKTQVNKLSRATFQLACGIIKGIKLPNSIIDTKELIDATKGFIKCLKNENDSIIKFKKTLSEFISKLPNKRLVMIVDELDRCRPDYAMKTLEIIKHFFDIEGLFVIVPTNEDSMFRCVKSLYGFENISSELNENYFKKFFDDKETLYKPNYLSMIENIINEKSLKEVIESQKIVLDDKPYNSIKILQKCLAKNAEAELFTIREMFQICKKAIFIINQLSNKVDCEYLAYRLCLKYSRKKTKQSKLSVEHRFYNKGTKYHLLNFSIPDSVFDGYIYNTGDFLNYYPTFRNTYFNSYKEFNEFYEKAMLEINNGLKDGSYQGFRKDYSKFKDNLAEFFNGIKQNIIDYQEYWDSTDNDNKIQAYYDEIVENDYKLFNM